MTTFDQERIAELIKLNSTLSKKQAELIVELENEMTANNDMVAKLIERGIIEHHEAKHKVSACFDVFLKKIVSNFGEDLCVAIYDYKPGDEIEFLNDSRAPQLENYLEFIASTSSELVSVLESDFDKQDKYHAMFRMIKDVSKSSETALERAIQQRKLMYEINKTITWDLDFINNELVKYVGLDFGKKSATVYGKPERRKGKEEHLLKLKQRHKEAGGQGEVVKVVKMMKTLESNLADIQKRLVSE